MATASRSQPLRGTRIVSLALNLPGPAALMRLRALGARCLKVEPPGPAPTVSGDPMGQYNPDAYGQMHAGIRALTIDLKSERGRARLARELAATDVLLTSFRPSALAKLGLSWAALQRAHPQLSLIEIVGASRAMGSSGSGNSTGVSVSPMSTPSTPWTAQRSPHSTSATSFRPRPSKT